MPLPSSGQLSLSEIATEYSVTQSNVSLATMSVDISLTAPHAVSEFYGRSSGPSYTPLGYTVVGQGGSYSGHRVFYNNSRWFITAEDTDYEYDISDNNAASFTQGYYHLIANAHLAFNGNTVCAIHLTNGTQDTSISRSTDNGSSYSQVYNLGFANISGLSTKPLIFYTGSNRWIAFDYGNSYSSTDNGQNWSFDTSLPGMHTAPGGAQSGSRIIINNNANFYYSDNGFSTYTTVSLPYVSGSKYVPNNIATDGSGTWLAWKFNPGGRMLKSTNNGASWSAISTDLPSYNNGIPRRYYQGTYGDGSFHIASSTGISSTYDGGVFSSSNDGSNFNYNPLVGTPSYLKGAKGLHHNGSDMVAAGDLENYKFN